jgi:hypothetical protein
VGQAGGLSVRGDIGLLVFTAAELQRSYSELPVRWTCRLALHPKVQELIAARGPYAREASLDN